ncbi:MAG: tRNA-modifying protein YgfZ [Actinomycetota bacterium]|nr:tRNA-modifying protein YgfZ [Actinomycetota bacterium]
MTKSVRGRSTVPMIRSGGTMEAISQEQLDALAEQRAFADLSAWRKVRLYGEDAAQWLHDLVTTDVLSIRPGHTRRSLLLSPTGRIRADFTVARDETSWLLLQVPDQPDHVGLLLGPYILSSDVLLEDATTSALLFAVLDDAAGRVGLPGLEPSVTGPGMDVIVRDGKPARRVEDMLVKKQLTEVGAAALDVRRIRLGIAKMGTDFPADALPSEAGLEDTIDRTKGCFLGQESVAKVRNLGHPGSVLRHLHTDVRLGADARLTSADGAPGGVVTSVAPDANGGTFLLARVPWETRADALIADEQTLLTDVDGPS